MAQFFTDFSEYTVGQAPSDWTPRILGVTSDLEIRSEGSENYLRRTSGTRGEKIFTWDLVPSVTDAEIVMEWRRNDFGTRDYSAIFRADPSLNTDTSDRNFLQGYYQPNTLEFIEFTGSTFPTLGSVSTTVSVGTTRYRMRVRVSGSTFKIKKWVSTDPEPELWDLEGGGITILGDGLVGVSLAALAEENYIYFFGVGTNGDPAPTEPVDGGTTDDLTANDLSSTSEVSSPAISQTHALTANDVSSLSSVGSPVLGQAHNLTSTDVQSTSQVSSPALATQSNTDNLTANDISSTSTVSSPALGQVHNLAANDATSASETGTPALQQTHALTSVNIQSLSTVSSPALTSVAGQDSLAANDVQAASTVSSPTVGQVHNLTPDSLSNQSETDSPTLGQVHALTASDLASGSQVSSPTLRDASQVLVTPIKNTRAKVSQVQYGATVSQTTYKAAIIQPVYKAEAG